MSIFKKFGSKKRRAVSCAAVIAAAGSSQRLGGVNKQFELVGGKPVLAHTLAAFEQCEQISEIIVVTREEDLARVCDICAAYSISKAGKIIVGGETRQDSVSNGVFAAAKSATLVAVHDGARPFVTQDIITSTIAAAKEHYAAAPAIPVTSTIKRAKNGIVTETVDRDGLFELQTPQIFAPEVIKAALTNAKNKAIAVTDDCAAVEQLGFRVRLTDGARDNIKLTTKDDFILAEAIIKARTGNICE